MYELILEGIEDDSERPGLVEALRKQGAILSGDLDDVLDSGPVTIDIALKRDELLPLYRDLKGFGGRVSIIRRTKNRPTGELLPHARIIHEKRKSLWQLEYLIPRLRAEEKRIVLVHGIFDLLHIGHIRLLNQAKDLGDVLIVSVTADPSVGRGPGNPFFNESLRQEALANLAVVDYVTIADSDNAVPVIGKIKPDVLVRGYHSSRERFDFKSERIALEDAAIKSAGGRSVTLRGENHSTNALETKFLEVYPQETASFLADFSRRWTFDSIVDSLEKCKQLRVLVIGDTIIDRYHYCQPLGKSAKENLVVNKSSMEADFAGGVIATANHVAQLSDNVHLVTFLGNKENSSELFLREKLSPNIVPHFFYRESGPTTVKKRYIATGSNQKLFEICDMNDHQLSQSEETDICEFLSSLVSQFDLVVINDFGHGMLTPKLIELIEQRAKCLALNVQVNGANQGFNLVTNYTKADFVCIDERELRLATRDKHGLVESLMSQVTDLLSCRQMIATRGAEGSMSFSREEGLGKTPAFATSSVDKVGAGDAFFGYIAPCFTAGLPQELFSFIGNCVGALKVQIVGNKEQVMLPDLLRFIERLLR